jgi:hypothetical protein
MASLLSGLKADDTEVYNKAFGQTEDSEEEDEDASKLL